MKKNLSQLLTLSLSLFLLFFFSCKKNLTPSNNSNSLDTSRLLKQYRMYFQPQVSPDSVIVNVSYDTVNRTITLNQYFDGTQSSPTSWKYFYNQAGYLTSINDISYGSPGNNMASILYDQNMDIKMVIVPYSPKTDSIYYTTNYNANGKEVILYDTSLSGYLGGTKFGVGKIIYNNQGQMTDRYLFGPGPSGTFDTSQLKLGVHEFFYYDVNGNLTIYQTGGDTLYQNASFSGTPAGISVQVFSQHDSKGQELYDFENILLKGVINRLSGNALIDPLYNIVGGSGSPTSYYFQIDKTVTLQATIPYQIDYNTGQWQYQTVYNQPAYDSLGRLTKTTLFSADSGVGSMDIYLKY